MPKQHQAHSSKRTGYNNLQARLSEIRFVKVKRVDIKDRLRKKQMRGILTLSCFLNVETEVFMVVANDKEYVVKPIVWEFSTNIVD